MKNHQKKVDACLETLALNCGIASSQDLFSVELSLLLDEMKERYESWDKDTPERFIFDMLVRKSYTAVVDYWETILMIIAANVEREKHVELKMDMLSLVEHFLNQEELHSTICYYSEIILKMILIPSIAWMVGKPNVQTRKAAIICTMRLIEKKLIEPEKLQENFKSMFGYMKNCLDDDWQNDIRFASVVMLKHLLPYLKGTFDYDDYKELYVELLKRLDDAQDGIRIETCKVFELFFEQLPDPWSSSLYEYCVKTIFIHLDDSNEKIQQAVVEVLKRASRKQTSEFLTICREFENKSSHPALVQSLYSYATDEIVIKE